MRATWLRGGQLVWTRGRDTRPGRQWILIGDALCTVGGLMLLLQCFYYVFFVSFIGSYLPFTCKCHPLVISHNHDRQIVGILWTALLTTARSGFPIERGA